jgi:hypothetical protein
MSLSWFNSAVNVDPIFTASTGADYSSVSPSPSGAVLSFEYFFHRLTEPYPVAASPPYEYWDRSSGGFRRAYYSKFLILSGGPDETPGVFLYSDAALAKAASPATALIANENNAMPFSVGSRAGMDVVDFTVTATIASGSTAVSYNPSNDPTQPSSSDLIQAAEDDISNQNLVSTGGIGGSG